MSNIGKKLEEIRHDSEFGLFQNLGYQTERINKKNLIIDTAFCNCSEDPSKPREVDENGLYEIKRQLWGGECITFTTELTEKLIIDKKCEVYIDLISFWGVDLGDVKDAAMPSPIYLNIKQFPKYSNSNNLLLKDKYIITPNGYGNTGEFFSTKGKKMNYLTTINPTHLEEIEFTLETETKPGADGIVTTKSIFNTNGRAIIELVLVSKD